ncbi:MAG: hypothetical protein Q8J89_10210 [Caulobacter sp.]|nr:hypothetical protein [Caulobacter sp.]
MIRPVLRGATLAAALTLLAGCVSITAVPAGPYAAGSHSVTLGRTWGDASAFTGAPKAVKMLTIDGWQLNRLYVIDGLRSGDYIVRPVSKEKPTPRFRTGMTPIEQVELVAESVAAMGYQRVETDGLRPTTVGGADGLRADIAAQTPEGLNISGITQIVETRGRLYVILYLAPAEHYFDATRAEVESIMASARVTG